MPTLNNSHPLLTSTLNRNADSSSSQNQNILSSSSHLPNLNVSPQPPPIQDPYHSRFRAHLPGTTSLLAGLPPPYQPLDRASSPPSDSSSFQDQFNRLSEPERHQFRITARQFSNEIRDIQHITDQVIRESTRASNQFINNYHNNNNNHNNTQPQTQVTPHSISDSLLFTSQPFEGLRRFREQMDRVSTQATSVNFDIAYPSETSNMNSNTSGPMSNSLPDEPPRIRQGSPMTVHRIRPASGITAAATPYFTNNPSTDEHPPTDPVHQNRTHEFVDHSARMRLNRRPRISPVPSSASDHDISESLESFRRCGERLKRVLSSTKLDLNDSTSKGEVDAESREPTTAELAEAAARASNEHHALPAFYSPDASLKVTKVVIPVDTNPMERRKIIFEASKDGSIRWKDAGKKSVYERSKDGLVGEEIGEIEFHYICLPKKQQPSNSLPPLGGGPDPSVRPSSFSLPRPSNQSSTDIAIGEAFERINEARTLETRATREHQYTYHPNRYQLYQRPRYRLVAASRRHIPLNRDLALDPPNPHRHWSTANRELNRSSSRPTTYENFSSNNNNIDNNNSLSNSRLTRRPISWPERFFSAPSDHHGPVSFSNNPAHQDQEQDQDQNLDGHPESDPEENSVNDDFDWDDPTAPFVRSPPFDESYSSHALVHF